MNSSSTTKSQGIQLINWPIPSHYDNATAYTENNNNNEKNLAALTYLNLKKFAHFQ